ncbi:unnamed protein product [Vitrella brassicaformis CCMP3155]|uniref:Uncharacterized protein n=2 Tax=Vitrella brassicaformis TaxID=1169539 RepID=A0A0G4H3A2_VITBC|nr:unnamed protein product [Vitrella brassicaformis CCMP3155]|eukprot:CEM38193.1 unnamed protein product [Vitrella brassicaformis CCMP3155]
MPNACQSGRELAVKDASSSLAAEMKADGRPSASSSSSLSGVGSVVEQLAELLREKSHHNSSDPPPPPPPPSLVVANTSTPAHNHTHPYPSAFNVYAPPPPPPDDDHHGIITMGNRIVRRTGSKVYVPKGHRQHHQHHHHHQLHPSPSPPPPPTRTNTQYYQPMTTQRTGSSGLGGGGGGGGCSASSSTSSKEAPPYSTAMKMRYAEVSRALQMLLKEVGKAISVASLEQMFIQRFDVTVDQLVRIPLLEYLQRKASIFMLEMEADPPMVALHPSIMQGPPLADLNAPKDEAFVVEEFVKLIDDSVTHGSFICYISSLCGKFIQRNSLSVTSIIGVRPLDLLKRHPETFLLVGGGNVTLRKYECEREVQEVISAVRGASKAQRVAKAVDEAQYPPFSTRREHRPDRLTVQHVVDEFRRLILQDCAEGVQVVYISSLCGRFLQRYGVPVTKIIQCRPADFLRQYDHIFVMTGGGNVGLREVLGHDISSVPPPPPRTGIIDTPAATSKQHASTTQGVYSHGDDYSYIDEGYGGSGEASEEREIAALERIHQWCTEQAEKEEHFHTGVSPPPPPPPPPPPSTDSDGLGVQSFTPDVMRLQQPEQPQTAQQTEGGCSDGDVLTDASLTELHDRLVNDKYTHIAARAVRVVCEVLKRQTALPVADILLGGSVACGVTSLEATDVSLVLCVDTLSRHNPGAWLSPSLDTIRSVLELGLPAHPPHHLIPREFDTHYSKGAVTFVLHPMPLALGRGDVAVGELQAIAGGRGMTFSVSVVPMFHGLEDVWSCLDATPPSLRFCIEHALTRETTELILKQTPKVKAAMRLMEFWRLHQAWSSPRTTPSPYTTALLTLHAAHLHLLDTQPHESPLAQQHTTNSNGSSNSNSVAHLAPPGCGPWEMVKRTFGVMEGFETVRVVWADVGLAAYTYPSIWPALMGHERILMDPVNPYKNLADPSVFDCTELVAFAQPSRWMDFFRRHVTLTLQKKRGGAAAPTLPVSSLTGLSLIRTHTATTVTTQQQQQHDDYSPSSFVIPKQQSDPTPHNSDCTTTTHASSAATAAASGQRQVSFFANFMGEDTMTGSSEVTPMSGLQGACCSSGFYFPDASPVANRGSGTTTDVFSTTLPFPKDTYPSADSTHAPTPAIDLNTAEIDQWTPPSPRPLLPSLGGRSVPLDETAGGSGKAPGSTSSSVTFPIFAERMSPFDVSSLSPLERRDAGAADNSAPFSLPAAAASAAARDGSHMLAGCGWGGSGLFGIPLGAGGGGDGEDGEADIKNDETFCPPPSFNLKLTLGEEDDIDETNEANETTAAPTTAAAAAAAAPTATNGEKDKRKGRGHGKGKGVSWAMLVRMGALDPKHHK